MNSRQKSCFSHTQVPILCYDYSVSTGNLDKIVESDHADKIWTYSGWNFIKSRQMDMKRF